MLPIGGEGEKVLKSKTNKE